MKYEALAESLIERYNSEEIIEEGLPLPAILLWAGAAGLAGKYVIENGVPQIITKLADENIVYQVVSVFDPTGIMSWPYVGIAMDEAAKNPGDLWKQALVIIACLGVVPGIGLGAKTVSRLVTAPITLPRWIVKLMMSGGRRISKNTKMMNEQLPAIIYKLGARSTPGGVNMGNSFRRSLKEVFDIDVTDDQLALFAAKNNVPIPRGLTISERALRAARLAVKTAPKFIKPTTRAARTLTAGTMAYDQLKSLFDKKPQKGIGRTPDVMGPKVQFGTIGGGIE